MNRVQLLYDNFSDFPLGPFPYDPSHSAIGEYHYFPSPGFTGQWYDPIVNNTYRGPSWLVAAPQMGSKRVMEQLRVCQKDTVQRAPVLVAGETDWTDYQVTLCMRALTADLPCGFLFRYQTSLAHYGLFFVPGGVELVSRDKTERIVLKRADFLWSPDSYYTVQVYVEGAHIGVNIDNVEIITIEDTTYTHGCIALSAAMPTQYKEVEVNCSSETAAQLQSQRQAHVRAVAQKRKSFGKMRAIRKIDLKDFGAGRQLRLGYLTGTDELFFIICQHQRRVFKDRYPMISCMTAVSLESGQVLWQIGNPRDSEDVVKLTTDLPVQVYDIDGDGVDEVITSWDFKLMILDGKTGEIKREIPTPENIEDPKDLYGIEFGRHAYHRLNVDAIRIVNVSGNDRSSDILIKDRYARLWMYDKDLNFLWTFTHGNTGHFPVSFDINNDGKDEIFSCYNMIDSSGNLLWSLPIQKDHTDEIIFGSFDVDKPHEQQIAIVSGWEGFMIVNMHGNILCKDVNGHGQRISAGNYLPQRKGYEICTTTFWINQGIIYLYDGKGNLIWKKEARCNGNIISPVNWDNSGQDLILLNANPTHGGLIDGEGDVVIVFPDDGHPELCAEVHDIDSDGRDEILVWDRHSLWVYANEEPVVDTGYRPIKYPLYNASNYRGEYSFNNTKQDKEVDND